MRTVVLELPEDIYESVRERAEQAQQPLAEWLVTHLSHFMHHMDAEILQAEEARDIMDTNEEMSPRD